jgi:hypothetical protein
LAAITLLETPMSLIKLLLCLASLGFATCAPALAGDAAMRPTAGLHRPSARVDGVAWGMKPGIGQLGAAGLGYYHTDNCWRFEPTYDGFDNYLGERRVNICLALHGG